MKDFLINYKNNYKKKRKIKKERKDFSFFELIFKFKF